MHRSRYAAAAAAVLVLALAGCSAAASSADAPVPAAAANAAAKSVPPGCFEDLAAIRYPDPSTEAQAEADATAMEDATQGQANRATALAAEAGAYVSIAAGKLHDHASPAAALKNWTGKIAQIRSCCS